MHCDAWREWKWPWSYNTTGTLDNLNTNLFFQSLIYLSFLYRSCTAHSMVSILNLCIFSRCILSQFLLCFRATGEMCTVIFLAWRLREIKIHLSKTPCMNLIKSSVVCLLVKIDDWVIIKAFRIPEGKNGVFECCACGWFGNGMIHHPIEEDRIFLVTN